MSPEALGDLRAPDKNSLSPSSRQVLPTAIALLSDLYAQAVDQSKERENNQARIVKPADLKAQGAGAGAGSRVHPLNLLKKAWS